MAACSAADGCTVESSRILIAGRMRDQLPLIGSPMLELREKWLPATLLALSEFSEIIVRSFLYRDSRFDLKTYELMISKMYDLKIGSQS